MRQCQHLTAGFKLVRCSINERNATRLVCAQLDYSEFATGLISALFNGRSPAVFSHFKYTPAAICILSDASVNPADAPQAWQRGQAQAIRVRLG